MNIPLFRPFVRAIHPIVRILLVCVVSVVGSLMLTAPPSKAQQFAQFGKIKPQYRTFEWNSLQARSFDIYYHEGGEYLAQYAGVVLEDAAKSTQRVLGFVWNERLPVIIYNSFNDAQQTNAQDALLERGAGGINELRKNRIVVAFRGDWEMFRLDLRRELTVSMIQMLYYGAQLPSPINGQLDLPVWFVEGLAEFVSHEGLDTETDMLVRDIVVGEQFSSMSALEGYARVKMGQMLFWYIAEKFGPSKISELITRARGMGTVEGAFRATFGVQVDGFTTLWKRELREMYGQDGARYEDIEKIAQRFADAAKDGSQMFAGVYASPAFAPNGERFAYLAARGGDRAWAVYVQDMRPKRQDRLDRLATTGHILDTKSLRSDGLSLSWKPDGTQVAFITQSAGADGIALVNVQTGAVQRLEVAFPLIRSLAFAPDGKSIAFVATQYEMTDIYLYDLQSKRVSKLTDDIFTENLPTWSSDGKTLFFTSNRAGVLSLSVTSATFAVWEHETRSSDVYALTLQNKKIERITNDAFVRKTGLAISSDGKKLLIASDRSGITNLYEWNIASGTLIPKTNLLSGVITVSLSRDMRQAALVSMRKGACGMFFLPSPFERKAQEPQPTELRKQAMERESIADKALGRSTTTGSGISSSLQQPSQPVTSAGSSSALDTSVAAGVSKNSESKSSATPSTSGGNSAVSEIPSPTSYGKYDIDFSRQKMVEPNPDVAARSASQLVADYHDYTKPGKLPSLPLQYSLDFDSYSIMPSFDTFFGGQAGDGAQAFFGNIGMTGQALWQDLMGNHRLQIYANVMFNFVNNDIAATYSYLPELLDYEASILRSSRQLLVFDAQSRAALFARLTYWGGSGKVMLPLGAGMRVEGKISLLNTIRESLDPSFSRVYNQSDILVLPEVRFVLDNTETGFFGSISGARAQAKIESVPGLAGLRFVRAFGDYRHYLPIKNFAVVVGRFSLGANIGETPQPFYAGGQEQLVLGRTFAGDYLPFNRAEDILFAHLVSPLRGFPIFAASGNHFVAANVEARVSLLQPDNSNSMLNNIINGLQAVAFVDAGSAWSNTFRMALATPKFDAFGNPAGFENGDILMSFGLGLRTYLLGQYPIKIDLAFQNLQTGISAPSFLIGFGYNF